MGGHMSEFALFSVLWVVVAITHVALMLHLLGWGAGNELLANLWMIGRTLLPQFIGGAFNCTFLWFLLQIEPQDQHPVTVLRHIIWGLCVLGWFAAIAAPTVLIIIEYVKKARRPGA